MRFPYREPEVLRLAHDIAAGLAAHTDVFPAPPYSAQHFEQALASYDSRREATIAARASAVQSTAAKDAAFVAVQDMAKSVLRYAENHTRGDDTRLQLLGWGGRRARTKLVTDLPGQACTLGVLREGTNWVVLDWKEPMDGGEVSAYKVQRRKRDSGDWVDVGTAVESEITLNGQEPGIEYEYQVIAVNKAGDGPASNVARVVL